MAKLPEALVKPTPRVLKDLRPGERALFPLHALRIDAQRNVFLFVNTELAPPVDEHLEYGEVWLDDLGKCHVDLKATKRVWEPKDLTIYTMSSTPHLISVESITWSAEDKA